jgi:hypothetical protein
MVKKILWWIATITISVAIAIIGIITGALIL